MSIEQFQAALIEIRALYEMLGRIGVFARLGVPEAEQRYKDVVCEIDYRYSALLDGWPSARDDTGIIEAAKAARRLVNEIGEAA